MHLPGRTDTKTDILAWGAHKGRKLETVPIDYLEYFIKRWEATPGESVAWARWLRAFKDEVGRRRGTQERAEQEGLRIDEDPVGIMRPIEPMAETDLEDEEAGACPLQGRDGETVLVAGQVESKKEVRVWVKRLAIEDVSLCLLREFIVRGDKTQGIVSWVGELAVGALKYGEVVEKVGGKVVAHYVGRSFHYDSSDPRVLMLAKVGEIGK